MTFFHRSLSFVFVFMYLPILSLINNETFFLILAILNSCCFFYLLKHMIETKGLEENQIKLLFENDKTRTYSIESASNIEL